MKIRDISHHDTDNGPIDLSAYDGVIVKVTEGTGYIDPKSAFNVAMAAGYKKPFGLYHYLSFASDVKEQISDFSAQIAKYKDATLRPALDVEIDGRNNKTVPDDINQRIASFSVAFPGIMLYANPDMLGRLDTSVCGKLPLWQAEYNPKPRDIPGYNRIGWQYREDPDESIFTGTVMMSVPATPIITTPKPAAPVDNGSRPAPAFPLPSGSYFGPRSGPAQSVSGYYSHRDDLKRWQQRMADRGWKITADGLYGDQTADVTRKFQAEKHLTVDGKIGPQTWEAAWAAPITH